jgi:hypothetical protein
LTEILRRPTAVSAALLLVAGAMLTWHSAYGGGAGRQCAWLGGADSAAVERFLRDWSARHGGPRLEDFDLRAGQQRLELDLRTSAGRLQLALDLAGGCGRTPRAGVVGPATPAGFPGGAALRDLADHLPVPRGVPGEARASTRGATWFALLAWLCLVVAALAPASGEPRRWWTAGVLACGVPLVAVAAWPLLDRPFDTDAHVLRAAFAAGDVFGDWNHPFLPYLLNRPATWISLEPRVLRAIPLAFLCLETALTMVAAARAGGPLAGALAGVWFACEAPRRHGVADLGDWDVAGTFLMALLLWTQRREAPGAVAWVVLAALLAAGVFSSWLMIVPAALLVACLAVEARQRKVSARALIPLGLVVVALAYAAARVFVAGARSAAPGHSQAVVREMLVESPFGRNAAMAVPLALGLLWAALGLRRLAERFTALTLLAVPVAVAVAFRWSHVNGGYYVGLVTPLACAAGAVAVVGIVRALEQRLPAAGRPWAVPLAVRALVVVGVVVLTVDLGRPSGGSGWEYGKTFTRLIAGDQLPILTNSISLARLLAFERARAGQGPIAHAHDPPADLVRRVRLIDRATCAPRDGWQGTESGFYLAHFRDGDRRSLQACRDRFGASCHELQEPAAGADRATWVYRCDPPGPR